MYVMIILKGILQPKLQEEQLEKIDCGKYIERYLSQVCLLYSYINEENFSTKRNQL